MPKPLIFGTKEKTSPSLSINAAPRVQTLPPMEIDRLLRKQRSPKYIEAIKKMDAGGHVPNPALIKAMVDAIKEELPEINIEHLPIGIVAKCFLEPPHEVHCLDIAGAIVKHYKTFESLPPRLERARSLAIHDSYLFIEVYENCLRAVKRNGTISLIKEEENG